MSDEQSGPGGRGDGGAQDLVVHHTWHPPASPAPALQNSRATAGIEGAAGIRSLENSPERTLRPRAAKKSAFNMKGLIKSVSTHSFTRRSAEGATSNRTQNPTLEPKGWLLEKQGKLDEAEMMYSRHCLRSQKHHGKESLSLANDLDRLAHLLHIEGKLEEAEPLSRRALEIRRKALGEESEQVATAYVNLGRILEEKESYADSLSYLKKGLAIRERVLEDGHPDTVSALAWIGDIHCKRENYQEGLLIAKRVAHAYETKLGPDDVKVASSLNNLAGLLASLGETDEALPLFARSHDIYVRQLGVHHPHTVATQLWVQQLSAPPPPPPRRHRPSLDGRPAIGDRLPSPPPPLMEGNAESEDGSVGR